jgi:hypothetical protein
VTGRLAALFDALVAVAAGVALAAGDAVVAALLPGAEGCAVFVGALVVHADAARRSSDASTSACDRLGIIFILKSTLLN